MAGIPGASHELLKQLFEKEAADYKEFAGKKFYRTYSAHDWDGTTYDYGELEKKMSDECKVKMRMKTQWKKITKDQKAHRVMDKSLEAVPGLIEESPGGEDCEYTFEVDYGTDEKEAPDYFEALSCMRRNVLAQHFRKAAYLDGKGKKPAHLTIQVNSRAALVFLYQDESVQVAWNLKTPERETKHAWNSFFAAKAQGVKNTAKPKMNCMANAPEELAGLGLDDDEDTVWIIFSMTWKRHLTGKALWDNVDRIIDLPYQMKYHASCAEAYIHSKMRSHCNSYIQVLNRADIPDVMVKKGGRKVVKKGGKKAAPKKKKAPPKKKKSAKKKS